MVLGLWIQIEVPGFSNQRASGHSVVRCHGWETMLSASSSTKKKGSNVLIPGGKTSLEENSRVTVIFIAAAMQMFEKEEKHYHLAGLHARI